MYLRRIPPPPKTQTVRHHFTITNTINTNVQNVFTIYNLHPNVLLEILYEDKDAASSSAKFKYLSANRCGSEIGLEEEEDGSGRQKWVIEPDDTDPAICYIKSAFYHKLGVKYMGCPNKSGFAYLYTSKNRYTKWRILPLDNSTYQFVYAGEKFDPSEVALVVARYAESVDWAMAYNDIAVIYNKSQSPLVGFQRLVNIENVGREGHTYLYHIIHNYEELAERSIFLQADPFLHNPTLLFGVDNYFMFDPVQPLGLRYLKSCNLPPLDYVERNKVITDVGFEYLRIPSDGDLISPGFHDVGMVDLRLNADLDYPEAKYRNVPLVEGFLTRAGFPNVKSLFGKTFDFTFCGLFSVNKQKILYYSIETYKGLLDELVRKKSQGGTNGYVLEKTWLYIFDNAVA